MQRSKKGRGHYKLFGITVSIYCMEYIICCITVIWDMYWYKKMYSDQNDLNKT